MWFWQSLRGFLLLPLLPLLGIADAGLSDFGGDVSQYMALLQGSSAFSFKPSTAAASRSFDQDMPEVDLRSAPILRDGQGHRRRDKMSPLRSESALGDFGGDYGNYLKLLEGNSALGFNPQSDTISDNQDLQSDVFGGGMTGKFWNMYKGSTSYDSYDESDSEALGEEDPDMGANLRQSPEEDQPEDEPNSSRGERKNQEKTVLVAVKPSKQKVANIFNMLKDALKAGDKSKIKDIIDTLDLDKLVDESSSESSRSLDDDYDDDATSSMYKKQVEDNDNEDDYSKESQKENESRSARKSFEEFVDKMKTSMPDPIATSKGLTMSMRNLTMFGLTDMVVCGPTKKSFGLGKDSWIAYICLPRLTATVISVQGPGVPFKIKLAAIFKEPKMEIKFAENPGGIHVTSVKTVSTSGSKFVPTYDSSIPLNPWSKVSLSGYLVSRVKKMMPSLIDKTILKIAHIVEKLE